MESDPATLVTGTPTGLKAPRVGDVLVERFELAETIESDCLVHAYRAIDQETDAPVLVRVTAPGLLGEKDARRLVERLRALVGATSDLPASAWPTLLDVDREGALVVCVEKLALGATFRSVLDSRKKKNKRFTPAELLPLANKLCAALDSLPSTGPLAPFHHGDLRAQRIVVHPDGLTATGAFLVGALPGDAVADAISRDVAMRRLFAPEVADGLGGRPADRFAVAMLIWEALEGKAPPPAPRAKDSSIAKIGELLCRYLTPDPAERPSTLRPLVEALAEGGKVSWIPDPLSTHADRAKAKRAPSSSKDLDPALVAAARAASAISNTGTFKLDDDELLPVTGSGPMPAPKQAAEKAVAKAVEKAVEKAKTSIPPPKSGPASHNKSKEKQAAKAKSHTPAPRKRKSTPSPRPKPEWEHAPLPKTAPLPAYVERETLVGPPPPTEVSESPERSGVAMVLGAVALAMLILGAAFWYRKHQEDARHEREVEAWIQAHQQER